MLKLIQNIGMLKTAPKSKFLFYLKRYCHFIREKVFKGKDKNIPYHIL